MLGLLALLWSSARAAAELAAFHGRRACGEAGVQSLDHTAILERISLRHDGEGRLRWLRRYRFEYSQRRGGPAARHAGATRARTAVDPDAAVDGAGQDRHTLH